jgi:lysophospholipase L1-like esterase
MVHLKSSWRGLVSPRAIAAGLVSAVLLLAGTSPALARDRHQHADPEWVGTWTASPSNLFAGGFNDQTLRLIAHTSIGGDRVRVRLSNTFGTTSLAIGEAHVAMQSQGAAIHPGTDRQLKFGGRVSVTIPPGALVVSDPVDLDVQALSNLAVSLYLPGATGPITEHSLAVQTNYASTPGNYVDAGSLPVAGTRQSWAVLSGIEVLARDTTAVVTFGDSITDGYGSTVDANRRWPNILAERLQARHMKVAVLDQGISGNRVLHDGQVPEFGPNALSRFDRDVLAQSGVKFMVLLEGINDFGHAAPGTPEAVSAEDIIAGYRQIVRRAHAQGIKVYGATLTPYVGTIFPGYFQPEGEAKRQAVNAWIRTSGAFDAVIDFDATVRDPANPTKILPAYDVGDHLHPNDAGYRAMANAVDLRLFRDDD